MNYSGYEVLVTADMTNAEGNMTHYEHVRLLTQAVEKELGSAIWTTTIPGKISFKYYKDILPGQNVTILLSRSVPADNSVMIYGEFINPATSELHTIGVFQLFNQEPAISSGTPGDLEKAATASNLLKKGMRLLSGGSGRANYIFSQKVRVCFGRTSHTGFLSPFEYANIMGETRELFGLSCIPNFTDNIGKKFLLATNEAHYEIRRQCRFGDEIHIKMWVHDSHRASFNLRAEYWCKGEVYAIASQRIAYKDIVTGKLSLPRQLRQQLKLIEGYSSRFSATIRRYLVSSLLRMKLLVAWCKYEYLVRIHGVA